jgi:hypothetical protein
MNNYKTLHQTKTLAILTITLSALLLSVTHSVAEIKSMTQENATVPDTLKTSDPAATFFSPEVIAAVVTVVGTALISFLTIVFRMLFVGLNSRAFRKNHDVPNIVGTRWKAVWYDDVGKVYVGDDVVTIKKWTKQNKFVGWGDMKTKEGNPYRYPIEGEVTAARIVVLNYKAERFPTEGLIGSACLLLDDPGARLEGYWVGKREVREAGRVYWDLLPGKVTMTKIKK